MKGLVCLLILALYFQYSLAEERKKGRAKIYGRVINGENKIRLKLICYDNYFADLEQDMSITDVPVDSNGNFSFIIPILGESAKFQLRDSISGLMILPVYNEYSSVQIASPGDSIFITLTRQGRRFKIQSSGIGISRYELPKFCSIDGWKHKNESVNQFTRYLSEYIDSAYANNIEIDPKLLSFVLSDYIGSVMTSFLFWKLGVKPFSRFSDSTYIVDSLKYHSVKSFNDSIYNFLKNRFPNFRTSSKILELRYQSAFYEFLIGDNYKSPDFGRFFTFLTTYDDPIMAERLVFYCILSHDAAAYFGSSPSTYKECIDKAILNSSNRSFKNKLIKIRSTRTMGSDVSLPPLPFDTSGGKFNLKAYRGKVVFVDMWPFQCGGCAHFAKAFHEGVYNRLKNDSNFVVVSIMVDPRSGMEKYIRRLRGEGSAATDGYDFRYTFPEYINLYAGKEFSEQANALIRYWDIYRSPYSFVVGKDGRLLTSTLPYFDDPNSIQCNNTLRLLKEALVQKK